MTINFPADECVLSPSGAGVDRIVTDLHLEAAGTCSVDPYWQTTCHSSTTIKSKCYTSFLDLFMLCIGSPVKDFCVAKGCISEVI